MNMIEDSNYIYIDDLKEIRDTLILLKQSKFGANSQIYIYKIKELLKVFIERESIYKLTEMEILKDVPTTNIVKPNKFLFVKEDFYGFSMKRIKGSMLAYVHPTTLLSDFLSSFKALEIDLKTLSKEKFWNADLNVLNVIYNKTNKQSYIIDSNSFICSKKDKSEYLTIYNLVQLYSLVLSVLSRVPVYGQTDNYFLIEMRNMLVDKTSFDEPIDVYFRYIIEYLEDCVDKELYTIGDFRKALKLTNN